MASKPQTIGQYLINQALPEQYRSDDRVLDSKTANKLLAEIAQTHPEQYSEIIKKLNDVATVAQGARGGFSPSIRHLRESPHWKQRRETVKQKIQELYGREDLTDDAKKQQLVELLSAESKDMPRRTFEEADKENNPFAWIVKSGMKGKPANVNNLIGAPLLFADDKNRPVPIPVLNGYARGLSPSEYWASQYGTRKGTVDAKMATRDSGFLCLMKGTMVRMADFTTKPIEEIVVGDMVMGVDICEDRKDCLTEVPVRVTATFNNGERDCWDIAFSGYHGEIYLCSTLDHKVYGRVIGDRGQEVFDTFPAGIDDELNAFVIREGCWDAYLFFRSHKTSLGRCQTYDIEVDSENHLFVLANGLIVSNSKQLVQIGHRGVVTDDDDPETENDESRGLPVDVDDDDNIGALLAHTIGPYKRNTVITARVLRDLKRMGKKRMLVRSPSVGGPQDGSVYARDVGIREFGRLPVRGENPGVLAAHALSEPVSQSSLSSKHCLAEGTLVLMADESVKPIEQVKVGDMVTGVDDSNHRIPVRVLNVFDNGERTCQRYVFKDAVEEICLEATRDHWINGVATSWEGQTVVGRVQLGWVCSYFHALVSGKTVNRHFPRTHVDQLQGKRRTWDIEVDSENHWFVLANGLIVHNSAGVVNAQSAAIGGFKAINQMVQVPKESGNWAAHAQEDGVVLKVEQAPQGGSYVYVGDSKSYVPPGVELKVEPGDKVEAGDILSGGLPNPAQVTAHKGIGEGRRYFVQEFTNLLRDNGLQVNRRNVELIARGLINTVEMDQEMDEYVQGDKVPYNMLEKYYRPREDSQVMSPKAAKGMYLEKPILHYTIGTPVRPSMIQQLKEFGIENIQVHPNPPPFRPQMVRAMGIAATDPDFITSMQGSGIKRRTLEAVHRGHSSNPLGSSYVSGIVLDPQFAQPGRGRIESPVDHLDDMQQKRWEAPDNIFDIDEDDD